MSFVQSIEIAREQHIGSHGISARALDAALARAEGALDWLRARHSDRSLPLLRLAETRGDLENIRDTARRLADRATDIVILGTGGSSLGGQTLAQLAGYAVAGIGSLGVPPRLHFIDNLDADSFAKLLARLPHATARFVAISKSGGTAETLMQTIAVLSALTNAGLQTRIPDIFLGITETTISGKANGLRDLLGKFCVPMLDHDPGVGGRYSDEWHRIHFNNPRDVVPESNMPQYPWFQTNKVEGGDIQARMKALRTVGVPYSDEQIAKAPEALKGKTELDAVIAYLQGLGVELKGLH